MTGLHTGHASVRNNHTGDGGRRGLRATDFTVAELFKQAGYRTALFGKWGLAEPGTDGTPPKRGFDEFLGYLNNDHAEDYYPDHLYRGERRVELDKKTYAPTLCTTEAIRFLTAATGKPFFLEVAYTLPHAPLHDPPDITAKAAAGRPNQQMAAMIQKLDREVGRLLSFVPANTLVIFTSDNGAHHKDRDPAEMNSTAGLRGGKGDVYEGGIRTPWIARWPGRVPKNAVCASPVAFCDFLPTVADLTGQKLARSVDGESFLASLTPGKTAARRKPLYWEYRNKNQGWQAARDGKWKAVRDGQGAAVELYDLSADPAEQRDVAASHPALTQRLAAFLDAEHVDEPDYPLHGERRKKR
jgi:arylsulfatase A-like enzyme